MTVAVVNTVHTTVHTARTLTPVKVHVPGILWGIFSFIHKIHRIWRWYRKAEIYTNPKNFNQLIAGHVVNFAVGDSLVLRVAAQCILIATRIIACVEQIGVVSQAYRNWVNAITGNYQNTTKPKWDKGESKSCCSVSSAHWWKSVFNSIIERIKRIAVTTFLMFKELFVLNMRFMDAIESFSMSPETRNESINELFVNGTKFLDTMEKQQELLVDCLYENKPVVASILKGIGCKYTVTQLITASQKGLATVKTVNKVASYIGDVTKNAVWGFFSGIGRTNDCPACFKPDPTVPWERDKSSAPKPIQVIISEGTRLKQNKLKSLTCSAPAA